LSKAKIKKKYRIKKNQPIPVLKGPDTPDLPKKPWQFYVQNKRTKYSQQHPELSYGEVTKQLKQMYAGLQPANQKRWMTLARNDSHRYRREVQHYLYTRAEGLPVNKKRKREPGEPKGPKQPQKFFWEEKRLEFIAKFPRHTRKEVNREITRAWKELEPEKKQPYREKTQQDVLRYEEEMKNFLLLKQQGIQTDQKDKDDEEDSESEEERPSKRCKSEVMPVSLSDVNKVLF